MSDLDGTADQLATVHSSLTKEWTATTALWSDAVQRECQAEYLDPLDGQVWATVRALEGLAQVVEQARRHVR